MTVPGPGTLVVRGLLRGLLAGAALAVSYTSCATTVFLLVVATGGRELGNPAAMVVGSGVAAFAWIFAIFLGIIPAGLIGAVAGFLIGILSCLAGKRLTSRIGGWIGFGLGALFVLFFNLALGPGLLRSGGVHSPLVPYLFWVGGPSPFLLMGTAWMGWSLTRPLADAVWPWRKQATAV